MSVNWSCDGAHNWVVNSVFFYENKVKKSEVLSVMQSGKNEMSASGRR